MTLRNLQRELQATNQEKLRQSEEQFRLISENVGDLIAVVDLGGKRLYNSPSYKGLLGDPEALRGTDWFDEIHPDDREKAKRLFQETIRTGVGQRGEYRLLIKDGSLHFIESQWDVIGNEEGKPTKVVVVSRDVTQRVQAEVQIRASLVEKEVLLKEIHHRVKNNWQLMASMVSLQSINVTDTATREVVDQIQNRIKLFALIHQNLHQSKDLARIDFREYVESIVPNIHYTYRDVHQPPIDMEIVVEGIYLDFETTLSCGLIVNELVSNSFKHAFPSSGEGGEIRIGLRSNADNQFTLTVRDNGIGLPENVDFKRTESFGFQLVNDFTLKLDGTIDLDTTQGTGFRIQFRAPGKR